MKQAKTEINLITPKDLLEKMFPGKTYDELTEEEKHKFAEMGAKMLNKGLKK